MNQPTISWTITEHDAGYQGDPVVKSGTAASLRAADLTVDGWMNLFGQGPDGFFRIAPGYAALTFNEEGIATQVWRAPATGARLAVNYKRL